MAHDRQADAARSPRDLAASLLRPLRLRVRLRGDRHRPGAVEAIDAFQSRWKVPDAADDPILIFASGWRSGSTLLQRLVIGSGQALVWGEPWYRTDTIRRLAESLRPIGAGWPSNPVFLNELVEHTDQLKDSWVANLFPGPESLIEAHRALLRALFDEPARQAGYDRWGIKAVRLGIDEIAYLRLLFPRASVVFIVRNPYDSWVSYRAARLAAYERFPDRPVFGAVSFGRVWADHVEGVLAAADRFDVLCIRYEDLVEPTESTMTTLENHVDLELDWSVLDSVIDGSRDGKRSAPRLFGHERWAISWTTGRTARRLGYTAS